MVQKVLNANNAMAFVMYPLDVLVSFMPLGWRIMPSDPAHVKLHS